MFHNLMPCPALNGKFGAEFAFFAGYVEGAFALKYNGPDQGDQNGIWHPGQDEDLDEWGQRVTDYFAGIEPTSNFEITVGDCTIAVQEFDSNTIGYMSQFTFVAPGFDPIKAYILDVNENP